MSDLSGKQSWAKQVWKIWGTKSNAEKILEKLEQMESERVKDANEEISAYNPLVNPSVPQKISYTQDGANSQENSTVVFKYAPNQLYKIYCRLGYMTDFIMANYKIRENCYIVYRVAEEIELRVSDKKIIKIRNKKWWKAEELETIKTLVLYIEKKLELKAKKEETEEEVGGYSMDEGKLDKVCWQIR